MGDTPAPAPPRPLHTGAVARVGIAVSTVDVAFVDATPTSVCAELRVDGDTHRVSFDASAPLFHERSDALVPLALMAGMRRRQSIRVHGPVSARLLANVEPAQQILRTFTDGELRPVPVVADPVSVAGPRASGTACFFSGGVDSFASALRHGSSLTCLVYVQGFDVLVDGTPRASAARAGIHAAADELGLPLVEVATNLRDVTDPFADLGHGARRGDGDGGAPAPVAGRAGARALDVPVRRPLPLGLAPAARPTVGDRDPCGRPRRLRGDPARKGRAGCRLGHRAPAPPRLHAGSTRRTTAASAGSASGR